MTARPRLVLHVGMQQTGARMVQRGLSRLRPQLRRHGVAFIGHRALDQLEHRAGWRVSPQCDERRAQAFEAEVAELAEREVAEVTRVAGPRPVTVLVSSDHLLGGENLGAADHPTFRPCAEAAVGQMLAALEPAAARLLLYTRRQDRLMEFAYVRAVRKGAHHDFREQFPDRFAPTLDYAALLERLLALPRVSEARVRPFELVEAGVHAFIDDFLAVVGLRGALDLSVIGDDLIPYRVYSRRGLDIALAANPLLENEADRRAMRGFLLEHYATSEDRPTRFVSKRMRARILDTYRPVNERLFREHMPDLPSDSYASNEATARLAGVLPPHTGASASAAPARKRSGSSRIVGLARGAPDRAKQRFARLAERNVAAYRLRLRYLKLRGDAFLVSFPKCGRTWLRAMVGVALAHHVGVEVRNPMRFTDAGVPHPGVPRILATHDDSPQAKPADRLLRDKRGYRNRRVVLLVRDPRDVVVSLYFHNTRRRQQPYEGSLSDFLRDPVGSLDALLAFYDIWAEEARRPHVRVVRYEDLHADAGRVLADVLAFLGVDQVPTPTIEAAVAATSFDAMQRVEGGGRGSSRALRTATPSDPESYKARRGQVGGFVDYLTPDDIAYADDRIARSAGAAAFGYGREGPS